MTPRLRHVRRPLLVLVVIGLLVGGQAPPAAAAPTKPGVDGKCGIDMADWLNVTSPSANLPVPCPPDDVIDVGPGRDITQPRGGNASQLGPLCQNLSLPSWMCEGMANPLSNFTGVSTGNPFRDDPTQTYSLPEGWTFLDILEATHSEVRNSTAYELPASAGLAQMPGEGPVWVRPEGGAIDDHNGGGSGGAIAKIRLMPENMNEPACWMSFGNVSLCFIRTGSETSGAMSVWLLEGGEDDPFADAVTQSGTLLLDNHEVFSEGEEWTIGMWQTVRPGPQNLGISWRLCREGQCMGTFGFTDSGYAYYGASAPGNHVGVMVGRSEFHDFQPGAGYILYNLAVKWPNGNSGLNAAGLVAALSLADDQGGEYTFEPGELDTTPVVPPTPLPEAPAPPSGELPPGPPVGDSGTGTSTESEGSDWWLGTRIINALGDLGDLLHFDLSFLIDWLGVLFANLQDFLRPLLAAIYDAIVAGFNGLANLLRTGFSAMIDMLELIRTAIITNMFLLANQLKIMIGLLMWLPEAIGAIFTGLLIPSGGLPALPMPPGAGMGIPTIGGLVPDVSTANSCGPVWYIPDPIDKTFRAPTPSVSGCPGIAGWETGRQGYDDTIGDVAGFRVAFRTMLVLVLWAGAIFGVLRAMPWSRTRDDLNAGHGTTL